MDKLSEKPLGVTNSILLYSIYPLLLFAPILFGFFMIRLDLNRLFIVGFISACTALIIIAFEYFRPEHKQWRPAWSAVKNDIVHLFTTSILPPTLFKSLFEVFFAGLAIVIAGQVGYGFWPHDWHLLLQMFLAIHLGDLGYYILHRALHTVPSIWPFHAVHHSPEELYVIASNRAHPIQIFFTFGAQMVILWTLGINQDALIMFSLFVAVNGQLQHCNINMRCGIFNWIFATPDLHRWHHSVEIPESNNNYGNNVILWDILLGTRFLPKEITINHNHIGLPSGTNFPESYWGHLMVPFDWENVRFDREK